MRVYRIPFSTNVERVALALGHKGVEVEWADVDPADRTPVRDLSGQDLVPVLDAGEEVVVDSTRIVEWLEERLPERPLFPSDEARRAELRLFVDWFDRVWKRPPNLLVERDDPVLRREMRESLDVFEALLAGRDYLFGDFSAADCSAFPFLKYGLFAVNTADDEPFHHVLAENLALQGVYPRLAAWIERVDGHPRA